MPPFSSVMPFESLIAPCKTKNCPHITSIYIYFVFETNDNLLGDVSVGALKTTQLNGLVQILSKSKNFLDFVWTVGHTKNKRICIF